MSEKLDLEIKEKGCLQNVWMSPNMFECFHWLGLPHMCGHPYMFGCPPCLNAPHKSVCSYGRGWDPGRRIGSQRGSEVSEGGWGLRGGQGAQKGGWRVSEGGDLEEFQSMGAGHLDIWGYLNIQEASEHMGAYKHMRGVWMPPKSPHTNKLKS